MKHLFKDILTFITLVLVLNSPQAVFAMKATTAPLSPKKMLILQGIDPRLEGFYRYYYFPLLHTVGMINKKINRGSTAQVQRSEKQNTEFMRRLCQLPAEVDAAILIMVDSLSQGKPDSYLFVSKGIFSYFDTMIFRGISVALENLASFEDHGLWLELADVCDELLLRVASNVYALVEAADEAERASVHEYVKTTSAEIKRRIREALPLLEAEAEEDSRGPVWKYTPSTSKLSKGKKVTFVSPVTGELDKRSPGALFFFYCKYRAFFP